MTGRTRSRRFRSMPLLAAVFGLAAMVGCDLLGSSDTGTMRVLLTDAPFPFEMVDSANVTIERVEVVSETEGVINITEDWTEPELFNLLDLRDGVTALLGEVEVPVGTYQQVRLIVEEEASVVMKEEAGGEVYNLKVPSGTETGVKIPLQGVEVEGNSHVTLTLDFAVDESFVVLGDPSTPAGVAGFNFKPVVKLLDIELSGVEDDEDNADEGTEE